MKFFSRHKNHFGYNLCLGLLGINTVSPLLVNANDIFDWISSFYIQITIINILAFIFSFIKYSRIIPFSISLAYLLFSIYWVYEPIKNSTNFTKDIRMVHSNVYTGNLEKELWAKEVLKHNPDVIAVQEVDQYWFDFLEGRLTQYQFRKVFPSNDNFGIGIYSKFPIKNLSGELFSKNGTTSITGELIINDEKLKLVYTHPVPPITGNYTKQRNKQLEKAFRHVRNKDNVIVFGDLNISKYSMYLKDIAESAGLLLQSRELNYTWPAGNLLLATSIDHVFSSPNIKMKVIKGEYVGSDHFPLIIDLKL